MKYNLLFLLILLAAVLSGNAGIRAEEYVLEPIVVTASRSPRPAETTSANIAVLSREEIEKLPARDVAEALGCMPGVSVERSGGFGSQATASIYGSETRHVSVYIDGVPLNLLSNPMTDLSKIPLNNVERIEVYKGTASSVWGSGLGGIINIITREPAEAGLGGQADLLVGENGTWSLSGDLNGTSPGRTGYLFSLRRAHSDGFTDHRSYDQDSVYGKATHALGERGRLSLAASFDRSDKDAPALYQPGRWDRANLDRNYQSLNLAWRAGSRLDFDLNLRRQGQQGKVDLNFDDGSTVNSFDYLETTWGISAKGAYRALSESGDGHEFGLGLDTDFGDYDYSVLGREIASRNQDVWATGAWHHGPLSVNLGCRFDDNMDFGSQFSPSAGLVWRRPGWPGLIRFQWSRGFSAPPYGWLFDPTVGNPDLGPERATTWQLGAEANLGGLRLEMNFFRADMEDMIVYDPVPGRLTNLEEVRRSGVEANISADLGLGLRLRLAGTWVEVENLRTGGEVPDIPVRIYDLGIEHRAGRLGQTLQGRWTDYNSSDELTRDRRMILDYLLKFDFGGGWSGRAAVRNLTNETEHHYWYLPNPDRSFEAGVTYIF